MACRSARTLFPVTATCAYMNNAADTPPPVPVAEAMVAFIEDNHSFGCQNFERWVATQERCRGAFARLVNADPAEIAFVKNTTQGLIIAAEAMPLRRGDLILVDDLEFPSNVLPWEMVARRRGARVKTIRSRVGRVTPDQVEQAVNRQVKVLALSAVQYENGFFADLEAIGEICERSGVFFVVDAIQACGVMPVDVRRWRCTALATGGHKFLMSVGGCGFLYLCADALDRLEPVNVGWLGQRDPMAFSSTYDPADGARRVEEGNPSMVAIFGLDASLALLLDIGLDAVSSHVLALGRRLVEGLETKGYRVDSPQGDGERSSITLFRGGPLSSRMLHGRLAEAGVVTALRGNGLRASLHLYNDDEDIDRLLDALP